MEPEDVNQERVSETAETAESINSTESIESIETIEPTFSSLPEHPVEEFVRVKRAKESLGNRMSKMVRLQAEVRNLGLI